MKAIDVLLIGLLLLTFFLGFGYEKQHARSIVAPPGWHLVYDCDTGQLILDQD